MASTATRAHGAGNRAIEEDPDPYRTCFERDRDRILHAAAFRRLAGKTQVFVFPADHQRTRMTHALEVAQIARSIAQALSLNVPLAEAMAIGHDCGHGPGGHASEDALSPFVDGGFDHAPWGADVTLQPLNLCAETLDGIRNHSWSLPAPATPEGEVVSWADRIAYVCHDFEDAVHAGIVTDDMLPRLVADRCGRDPLVAARGVRPGDDHRHGTDRSDRDGACRRRGARRVPPVQLRAHLPPPGESCPGRRRRRTAACTRRALRRPPPRGTRADRAGRARDCRVVGPANAGTVDAGSSDALRIAVAYVAGMTDRFACQQGIVELAWDPAKLPRGIGT